MGKQPGHLSEQLSLDPQTPGSSEHRPPLPEKQHILCFKEAPPSKETALSQNQCQACFTWPTGNELALWMDLYFIIIITPPL